MRATERFNQLLEELIAYAKDTAAAPLFSLERTRALIDMNNTRAKIQNQFNVIYNAYQDIANVLTDTPAEPEEDNPFIIDESDPNAPGQAQIEAQYMQLDGKLPDEPEEEPTDPPETDLYPVDGIDYNRTWNGIGADGRPWHES